MIPNNTIQLPTSAQRADARGGRQKSRIEGEQQERQTDERVWQTTERMADKRMAGGQVTMAERRKHHQYILISPSGNRGIGFPALAPDEPVPVWA